MHNPLTYEVIKGNPARVTVFLHGLMGRGRNFLQIANELTTVTTSILVDQPNHGTSPWTLNFSYAEMADRVAAQLRQISEVKAAKTIHLVGHSMGGKTAMQLALTHPELLSSLTVVDISPTPAPTIAPFDNLLGSLLQLDLTSLKTRREADDILRTAIADNTMRSFLLGNLIKRPNSLSYRWLANVPLLFKSLPQIVDFRPPANACFTGPVLWISGENSPYIKASDMPLMSMLFPDVLPVTVPHAGHWVHADNPKDFNRLLTEFITAES